MTLSAHCAELPPPQSVPLESGALLLSRRAGADADSVEYSSQQPDLTSIQV